MASNPTFGWSSTGESLDPVAVMLPDGSVRLYDSETDRVTVRSVLAEFPDHELFAASPSCGFEPLSPKRVLKPGGTYQIVPSDSVLSRMQPSSDCFPSSASHFPMDLEAICSEMREYDFRHEQGTWEFGPSISPISGVDAPTASGNVQDTDHVSTFATELRNISSNSKINSAGSSASLCSSSGSSFASSHGSIADQLCGKGFGFRRSAKSFSRDCLKATQLQQLTGTERVY